VQPFGNGTSSLVANGSSRSEESESKKAKLSVVCCLCLGVLDPELLDGVIDKSFKLLEELSYEWKSLCFNVTAPVAVLLREAVVSASPKATELGLKPPSDLKDAWKSLLTARLEAAGKSVPLVRNADHDPATVSVTVQYSYEKDEIECERVRKLDPQLKTAGKVHGRKYDQRVLTRAYVQSVLDGAKKPDLLNVLPFPTEVSSPVTVSRVEIGRLSYWMAGRYLKYSRTLSQTPWLIEGVRKGETSLEELIQGGIMSVVACDGVTFSSSGREDIDVRCLGKGRPFLCQIVNPRKLCNGDETVALAVRNAINEQSRPHISVRDVQFVSKSEAANLKEGEEDKVKVYRALCRTATPVSPEKLSALSTMTPIVVKQKTPIRVLHRRSLATRERTIHQMSAVPCPGKEEFFELVLETQAGTYIKEFVHGDLGRTIPNMSTILGVPTDILALDVEAVLLDWPPFID
jgi:tRNA pseudouridine synthase 10